MRARVYVISSILLAFSFILTGVDLVESSPTRILLAENPDPTSLRLPAPELVKDDSQSDPKYHQTVLLWPKQLAEFTQEYPNWQTWLGSQPVSAYAVRDELLVSVNAIAAIVPGLEVTTDYPDSNLIIVSGNPGYIWALLERLRDHPLLERFTLDSTALRNQAKFEWARTESGDQVFTYTDFARPKVNIRNNWVTNLVWGYTTPDMQVNVTLRRDTNHATTTSTISDPDGLYHAYLAWEIRENDVVEVDDGSGVIRIPVVPVKFSSKVSSSLVTGTFQIAPDLPTNLEITVGKSSQTVILNDDGSFKSDFSAEPFRAGTHGFLRYLADPDGNRIFKPFATPVVYVRRDTSWGLPYGSAHSAGISTIVWGYATPETALTVRLTKPDEVVTRTTTTHLDGYFSISMDQFIEDGDVVEVSDGIDTSTVEVPALSFQVDPVPKTITGVGPAGITSTEPYAPHTLGISIWSQPYQVTTNSSGEFSAVLAANPYLAGLLGSIFYITPDGNRIYKPIFVADPFARGVIGDWWADVILGQPDFSQITYNEVVGNKIFNPGGVYVDRSAQPNKIYVYDGGNSRVLGLSHLGVCLAGANAGQICTTQSDCPGSSCLIQEERAADIVFGQPSFNSSACNGDSGYQMYPDVLMASAATLCGMREEQLSITEGGSQATMAVDTQGNLYVPDFFNNRVLRYNHPFNTDTIADYVWGQSDFSGTTCNRGAGFDHSDARSLCFPGTGPNVAGVAIDTAGNLWVADTMNNRVLRFPFNPVLGMPTNEADLVLGQPDFSTITPGMGLNQLDKPTSVRVDSNGVVYIADSYNNRVLAFEPPLSNGMFASHTIGSGLIEPTGLEIDPTGGLWVNDSGNGRFLYFVNGVKQNTVNSEMRIWGGMGVDRDSNIMAAGHDSQQGLHYSAPEYTLDALFLRSEAGGVFNQTSARSAYGGLGLEVAAGQLIYGGGSRILFWNNPWGLTNYQAADGVVGEPDFETQRRWGPWFQRMRADDQRRLWVIKGTVWPEAYANIEGYQLPLKIGATPMFTVTSPLPLQGGGMFTWTVGVLQGGIDVQPECDCLWLSDQYNHRVFRIRNVSAQPVVDVVLGQPNIAGTQCNHGRGRDFPSRDSLCDPGALAFDKAGNLYLADHNLETEGNWRLLEFDANTIPDSPTSAVFGIPATRVLGRNGDFTEPNCLGDAVDPVCGPWEPAFDTRGRMVIGLNGYLGPRFPMVYQDPLTNPLPVAALGDFHSMPFSARFDQFDNLYILDGNRSRILVYRNSQVPTYNVTGTITTDNGTPIPGVKVETVGYASSGTTNDSGLYTLTGLIPGTYTIIPSKDGYIFEPTSRTIDVSGDISGQDFLGYQVEFKIFLPLSQR